MDTNPRLPEQHTSLEDRIKYLESELKKKKEENQMKKKKIKITKPAGKKKIGKVMKEFKKGELKSSSGQKVTNPKQAIAIGLSEAEKEQNKKAWQAKSKPKTTPKKKYGRVLSIDGA